MTTRRTFSLPDDLAQQLDETVAAAGGNASAVVAEALRTRIARDAYRTRLNAAYGEPDPDAYAYWQQRLRNNHGHSDAEAAPRAS